MREIILKTGNVMLIDDDFYDLFTNVNLTENKNGYITFRHNGKSVSVHRFIMNCPKDKEIDHIDLNPRNNTRDNLRICNRTENQRHRKKFKDCNSVYKGVYYNKHGFWVVHIRPKKEKNPQYKGAFSNEIAAANCYNYWAVKYFGEFIELNDCPLMNDWQKYKRGANESSKYNGVSWDKNRRKWIAQIWDGSAKRNIVVSVSDSEIECAKRYNEAALQMKGSKAKLNIICDEEIS